MNHLIKSVTNGYKVIIWLIISIQMIQATGKISQNDIEEILLKICEKMYPSVEIKPPPESVCYGLFGIKHDKHQKANTENQTPPETITTQVKQMNTNLEPIETSINATIIDDTLKALNVSLNMPDKRNVSSTVLDFLRNRKVFRPFSKTRIITTQTDNNDTKTSEKEKQHSSQYNSNNVQHGDATDMLLKAVLVILFILIILALAIFCSRIVYYYNY